MHNLCNYSTRSCTLKSPYCRPTLLLTLCLQLCICVVEPFLDVFVSSLHEGHANLLSTVPLYTDVTEVTCKGMYTVQTDHDCAEIVMASRDAPTLEGLACMHFSRASSVLNVTKTHTQHLCPESSLLALMDSCSCCSFFCTCSAALLPVVSFLKGHTHTHTHTHTDTQTDRQTQRQAEMQTETETQAHTETHTLSLSLSVSLCSVDICMSLCVSLKPRQGKADVMGWDCAATAFWFFVCFVLICWGCYLENRLNMPCCLACPVRC